MKVKSQVATIAALAVVGSSSGIIVAANSLPQDEGQASSVDCKPVVEGALKALKGGTPSPVPSSAQCRQAVARALQAYRGQAASQAASRGVVLSAPAPRDMPTSKVYAAPASAPDPSKSSTAPTPVPSETPTSTLTPFPRPTSGYVAESDSHYVNASKVTAIDDEHVWAKDSGYNLLLASKDGSKIERYKVVVNGKTVAEAKDGAENGKPIYRLTVPDLGATVVFIDGERVAKFTTRDERDSCPNIDKVVFNGDVQKVEGKGYFVSPGTKAEVLTSTKVGYPAVSSITMEYKAPYSDTWVATKKKPGEQFDLKKDGEYRFFATSELGGKSATTKADTITIVTTVGKNKVSYKVNSAPNTREFYKDKAVVDLTVNNTELLDTVTVEVNGKPVSSKVVGFKEDSYSANFDLSKLNIDAPGGLYEFTVTTTGFFKHSDMKKFTVKFDNANPTFGDASINGSYHVADGKIYTDGKATVSVPVSDSQSGVKDVTVSTGAKVTLSGGVATFPLITGEGQKVTVTDKVGHSVTKSLHDLGLRSNRVVVDSKLPVIKEVSSPTVKYTSDGKRWVSSVPEIKVDVTDDNLDSVKATVNGTDVAIVNGNIAVGSVKPGPDGKYEIVVKAVDKANNMSMYTATYYLDNTAPRNITGTVNGETVNRPYGTFAKGKLTLTVRADDDLSGIKGYYLTDKNGRVKESFSSSIELPSGENYVVAYDHLGNRSRPIPVSALIGSKSNQIYYDASKPSISVKRENGSYKNWHRGPVRYSVDVGDAVAVSSVTVLVNGTTVHEYNANKLDPNHEVNFTVGKGDGHYEVQVLATNGAGTVSEYKDVIKIDSHKPSVDKFVFTAPGYKPGSEKANRSGEYGFFFQGATNVEVHVSDPTPSSGIAKVEYTLRRSDGSVYRSGAVSASGGVANIAIPNNFKGYISATARDNVGWKSDSRSPSGIVTEDRNWFVNTSSISIELPNPGHTDASGRWLYKGDAHAKVTVKQPVAGVRGVTYGIDNKTLGTVPSMSVLKRDKNLLTSLAGALTATQSQNDITFWVKAVDNAGYTSETKRVISVDKNPPVVSVAYNQTVSSGFYKANRVATVTVKERNFDPSLVKVSGASVAGWHKGPGDTWIGTASFTRDGQYQWSISVTDRAGNTGNTYRSEKFTIDKTPPRLSVSYNATSSNSFYNKPRVATVSIVDANFDPSKVKYNGAGYLSGWSSSGTVHTASISFSKDGEYEFSLQATDKAGNNTPVFKSGKFIIDATKPAIKINGLTNGTSYHKGVSGQATVTDKYIESGSFSVTSSTGVRLPVSGTVKSGFTLGQIPKERKYDGQYTAVAVAKDRAGNTTRQVVKFSVNRFGPSYAFGKRWEYYKYLDKNIVFTELSVDPLNINAFNVVVLKDGNNVEVPKDMWSVTEKRTANKQYLYTITVNKEMFGDDGYYQVQLYSKDKTGRAYSSVNQEYDFYVDHSKPEITISGVESNKVYQDLQHDAVITINDLTGLRDIAVTVNGKPVSPTKKDGNYVVTLRGSSKPQEIGVTAVDMAGNESIEKVGNVIVTNSAWVAFIHSKWVWPIVVLVFAALVGIITTVVGAVRKRRRDEEAALTLGATAVHGEGIGDVAEGGVGEETNYATGQFTEEGFMPHSEGPTGIMDDPEDNLGTDIFRGE